MIKSYIFLIAIFYVFSLFIKVVNCDIHIIDNINCNNNAKETVYLGTNYTDEGRRKKEIYEELNVSSLGDIHDQEERKLNYMKNRKYNDTKNFDNIKNSSLYYFLLRKKTFIPFYLLLQEKIYMFDISKKVKDNLSAKQKKHAHFITNNKKEKEMINTSLLYKRSMYNKSYSRSQIHKLFPINLDVNSRKDDLGIYKMDKNAFNKTQKNFMFLELNNINLYESKDLYVDNRKKLELPNKDPINADNEIYKNNAEWIYSPDMHITCKEFSCPNSYQMCILDYFDEQKFFDGQYLYEILSKFEKLDINEKPKEYLYFSTYKCVCKKYLSDNLCDESVE